MRADAPDAFDAATIERRRFRHRLDQLKLMPTAQAARLAELPAVLLSVVAMKSERLAQQIRRQIVVANSGRTDARPVLRQLDPALLTLDRDWEGLFRSIVRAGESYDDVLEDALHGYLRYLDRRVQYLYELGDTLPAANQTPGPLRVRF
ncbi:MAG: hypothetical protein AAF458_12035 [Pseudomonadota bacterium]